MFDVSKFSVDLTIERVTRIPYSSGSIFVRWNVVDSPRPDAHGRTVSKNINNTEANFKYQSKFKQRIGMRTPSKLLRRCGIKFEVVWEPVGGRGVTIGTLNLDLSQFAVSPEAKRESELSGVITDDEHIGKWEQEFHANGKTARGVSPEDEEGHHHHHHHSAAEQRENPQGTLGSVSDRPLLYLLEGARNNCLLEVKIGLSHLSGSTDFKTPEFDGPAMNYSLRQTPTLEDTELANPNAPQHSRERLRRLRKAVLQDLVEGDHAHRHDKCESDWLNLDNFLMGRETDLRSSEIDAELRKYSIRDVAESSFDEHKEGTPYLETDVRENYINWNIMGY